jgi:hypothetical protein
MCDRGCDEPVDDCEQYEEELKHAVNAGAEVTQVQYRRKGGRDV